MHAAPMHALARRARPPRAGYWAFGWAVAPFLVSSFTFPTGLIAAVYVLAIMQIVSNYQIYARPTFGAPWPCPEPRLWDAAPARGSMERRRAVRAAGHARRRRAHGMFLAGFFYHYLLRASGPAFSVRNVLVRMTVTTVYTAVITAIACLIPFFGCGCPPAERQISCLLAGASPGVHARSSSSGFGQWQVRRTSFLGKLATGVFAAAVLQADAPVPHPAPWC
jgi:hypothetical protein